MPSESFSEHLRRLELQVDGKQLTPFFINNITQVNVLSQATSHARRYGLHDLLLSLPDSTVNSYQVLLSDGLSGNYMFDAFG